ncbi:Ribokinase-like protein [Gloeophyllum trabeum ATCC 11539]|uniref:Ribokinase-like protein n=1 Tax=Gloeophyllum trabeum (strain ATCC 11539 / FP-39264 / Madison 617) TaxID=670483 RepID=S7QIT8_GLOTA|nr:Ribokinase-like protein [Gloeophyllum trabeum ATCC 11539]EPQ59546.1 Ribokinase-like protein [Gloeophyllum trabeum ATCC 11539]
MASSQRPQFVSLGMFIIDEFEYLDDDGRPTGRSLAPQESQASFTCYQLPAEKVGMIIDRGTDFPLWIQEKLDSYGPTMWLFRDHADRGTTRALNSYKGDLRGFKYLTSRIRITPRDLAGTRLAHPTALHFICSPSRAAVITSEVHAEPGWDPITIYEPIPDRCVPEELPALIEVLPAISILSPNAEEALSLLSMGPTVTRSAVEEAAARFLEYGVGGNGDGWVIIRSGSLGAYITTRRKGGQWIPAFWSDNAEKVVDVTGAGNGFLGGLGAGLLLGLGDVYEAVFYATVSASFIIEQEGLPRLSAAEDASELWNDDSPQRRLEELRARVGQLKL